MICNNEVYLQNFDCKQASKNLAKKLEIIARINQKCVHVEKVKNAHGFDTLVLGRVELFSTPRIFSKFELGSDSSFLIKDFDESVWMMEIIYLAQDSETNRYQINIGTVKFRQDGSIFSWYTKFD